ncbi:ABC transporter substrate-binding protein [Halobellus litoreus]|uniref:ABC transporter substrate-binding protein n=1 Tax=Halobellus litoreus TaxID=755310 RepID=A0ABD6DUV8_9EURY|nr:ABC transporter substrate-binding protein [Halobellus litoreus]
MSQSDKNRGSVQRRRVLQMLGGVGIASLAGCNEGGNGGGDGGDSGGGGGDQQELGERVPEIAIEYWANIGTSSTLMENSLNQFQNGVEELGISLNILPTDFATQNSNAFSDARRSHLQYWTHSSPPSRLDPDELVSQFTADRAGADGANPANYANCEYTDAAFAQRRATSEEERRELVNSALGTAAEDAYIIPIHPRVTTGAYRPANVEIGGTGDAGLKPFVNPYVFFRSTPTNSDTLRTHVDPQLLETTNFPTSTSPTVTAPWSHLVHSTLVEFDENYDLQNMLAESIETSDDGLVLTVSLRDATFHNGDPITAEDVKFTFEFISDNAGIFPTATSPPYESIEVVDESTVEFTLSEVFRPLIRNTFGRWGILHRDTWSAAVGNAGEFDFDPIIGSGPFQVDDIQRGSFMRLTPHDGHPVHDVGHNVLLQAFADNESIVQAFQNDDLDMVSQIGPSTQEQLSDTMGDSVAFVEQAEPTGFYLYPQHPQSPVKFREFRQALGMSFNRQQIHDIVWRGAGEIEYSSCVFTESHPWRPPADRLGQFTDDPEGDVEGARELLSENGWGWDGNDNLRYPADADLSPLWPQGENPTGEDFPCLDENGEYAGGN